MVRAGQAHAASDDTLVGALPAPLSEEGRRQVHVLTRFWEWADLVVSSPVQRARETAGILAGEAPVTLDTDLRPRDLGPWEGRSADELRAAHPEAYESWRQGAASFELPGVESSAAVAARSMRSIDRALEQPFGSLLVVSHQSVIRAIAEALVEPLPPGRPFPAEMVLLTRQQKGRWALGRRSTDPPALQSPLERTGLSGRPQERPPERHVGSLEVASRTG